MLTILDISEIKVPKSINSIEIEKALTILDDASLLLRGLAIDQKYIQLPLINTRFYAVVHEVILPVLIRTHEASIPKAFLAPLASIYIHEQKIYAFLRASLFGDAPNIYYNTYRLPVIDLTADEKLLVLAAISIAYKIFLTPSERSILRIIPNNLKLYIETALRFFERTSNKLGSQLQPRQNNNSLSMVELVLWVNEFREGDIVEVSYIKGVSMRIFRIVYHDYEVDVRSMKISQKLASRIVTLLPSGVLASMLDNIEGFHKILSIFTLINS